MKKLVVAMAMFMPGVAMASGYGGVNHSTKGNLEFLKNDMYMSLENIPSASIKSEGKKVDTGSVLMVNIGDEERTSNMAVLYEVGVGVGGEMSYQIDLKAGVAYRLHKVNLGVKGGVAFTDVKVAGESVSEIGGGVGLFAGYNVSENFYIGLVSTSTVAYEGQGIEIRYNFD